MTDKPTDSVLSRRRLLLGAAGVGTSISLAGCMDIFSDEEPTETSDGEIDPSGDADIDRDRQPEIDEEEDDLRSERRQFDDPETPAEYFVYIYQRYSRAKAQRDMFSNRFQYFVQSIQQRNWLRAESIIDDLLFHTDSATRNLSQALSAIEEIGFEYEVSEEKEMLEDLEYAWRITPDVAVAANTALEHREENEIRKYGRELSDAEKYHENFLSRESRTVSAAIFGRSLMQSLQVDVDRERLEEQVAENLEEIEEDRDDEDD